MIVTSQPDVACDVCGRRLLRGEQPDVFLASGRRRMVCELCAPRASAEGWLREAEQARTLTLSPARPRQGRNPLARWRRPRRPGSESDPGGAEASAAGVEASAPPVEESATSAENGLGDRLQEVVEGDPGAGVAGAAPVFAGTPVEPIPAGEAEAAQTDASQGVEPHASEPSAVAQPEVAETDASSETEPVEEGSWRDAWMFVGE